MKSNLTVKLDADLLREIRVLAAQEDTSISALLSAVIEKMVRERRAYDGAKIRPLRRLKAGLALDWKRPRSRDELHER